VRVIDRAYKDSKANRFRLALSSNPEFSLLIDRAYIDVFRAEVVLF